jgi:hypothetical protein
MRGRCRSKALRTRTTLIPPVRQHAKRRRRKKGTVPICAKHPPGRSGKWGLSPFSGYGAPVQRRCATQPGALAPETAEDGDLAGRAELPGFGSVDSPSPKCRQIAPRQCSLGRGNCRSGNSCRRRSSRNARVLWQARSGGQSHGLRSRTCPAARHGECPGCRASGSPTATLRLECRPSPTAQPNSPGDATRGHPPKVWHGDTISTAIIGGHMPPVKSIFRQGRLGTGSLKQPRHGRRRGGMRE